MPDVFITLEEAAAFEGITYEAMKKRVQRSPKQHNVAFKYNILEVEVESSNESL